MYRWVRKNWPRAFKRRSAGRLARIRMPCAREQLPKIPVVRGPRTNLVQTARPWHAKSVPSDMNPKQIVIYDTTPRDGTQAEGISFSVHDKIRIAEKLDAFGIHYIEGGCPGSNPKDIAFLRRQSAWLASARFSSETDFCCRPFGSLRSGEQTRATGAPSRVLR
jgi:hypothetical protein